MSADPEWFSSLFMTLSRNLSMYDCSRFANLVNIPFHPPPHGMDTVFDFLKKGRQQLKWTPRDLSKMIHNLKQIGRNDLANLVQSAAGIQKNNVTNNSCNQKETNYTEADRIFGGSSDTTIMTVVDPIKGKNSISCDIAFNVGRWSNKKTSWRDYFSQQATSPAGRSHAYISQVFQTHFNRLLNLDILLVLFKMLHVKISDTPNPDCLEQFLDNYPYCAPFIHTLFGLLHIRTEWKDDVDLAAGHRHILTNVVAHTLCGFAERDVFVDIIQRTDGLKTVLADELVKAGFANDYVTLFSNAMLIVNWFDGEDLDLKTHHYRDRDIWQRRVTLLNIVTKHQQQHGGDVLSNNEIGPPPFFATPKMVRTAHLLQMSRSAQTIVTSSSALTDVKGWWDRMVGFVASIKHLEAEECNQLLSYLKENKYRHVTAVRGITVDELKDDAGFARGSARTIRAAFQDMMDEDA